MAEPIPSGDRLGSIIPSSHRVPAISADAKLVATVGERAAGVRLQNGAAARDLPQDASRHPYAIAFSPSGRLVASGRDDRAIHVWEAATGAIVARFSSPGKAALSLASSPDERLLGAGGEEEAFVIDLAAL